MACDISVTSRGRRRSRPPRTGRLTWAFVEPTRGLEPLTARLQVGCATNCATSAKPGQGTGRARARSGRSSRNSPPPTTGEAQSD